MPKLLTQNHNISNSMAEVSFWPRVIFVPIGRSSSEGSVVRRGSARGWGGRISEECNAAGSRCELRRWHLIKNDDPSHGTCSTLRLTCII